MLALSGWENLIVYIPTILFLLIFFWQLIAGLRRGLRKSTILFINMVIAMGVTLIIFFIFFGGSFDKNIVTYYNKLSNAFGFESLSKLFNTNIEHTRLSDYILDAVVNAINENETLITDTASLESAIQLIFALVQSLIKLFAFFIMLPIYFILKGILYIVYVIFFKEKRYKKKITQNFLLGASTKAYKPRHLWGMALGGLRGLIVGIFILSFIGSVFHILTNGEYSKDDLIEDDLIVADSFRLNSVVEMVNRYGKTGVGQVLEAVGTKKNGPWYLMIADGIISVDYKIVIDGDDVDGTFIPRKELGPIMGLVKDGYVIFRDYNVDMSRLSDPAYLSEALNSELDGISLADSLDKLIDAHQFGNYTISLCQSFLNALMANIPDTVTATTDENGNVDIAARILNCVFKGEHAVKASSLISNESITNALSLAITVLTNYQDINDFASRFGNSNQTESLVFGLKPLTEETKKTYDGVTNTLIAIGDYISKLDCVKDGLISDIVIVLLDTLNMDGIDTIDSFQNQEYLNSCYQVQWKNNLKDICDILASFVGHITEYNLFDTDALLDDIVNNLDDANSESRKLIDTILNADFSGVILNNPNLINIMSQTINNSTNGLIILGNDIKLGCYFDSNNVRYNGDLINIISNFIPEAKTIYNIVRENKDNSKMIVKKIFENESLTNKLTSIVDTRSQVYSPTLHSIISSALINLNKVMGNTGIRVVIEEQYIDNYKINSEVLTEALSTIIKYIPVFIDDSFDYKKSVTTTMLNDLAGIKLLRGTISEVIYYALSQIDKINGYIPDTYVLGEGNDANLYGWTTTDGEIDTLLAIINAGEKKDDQESKSLLQLFLNMSDDTDIVEEFLSYDYDTLGVIENSLVKSNVINCIIAGFVQDFSINGTKIVLPNLCLKAVGNKKKISSDLNLFTIMKQTDLYSIIKSDDMVNDIINFLFDTEMLDTIFSNKIINTIMTQALISLSSDSVTIVVPYTSYTDEALAANDKIIKTTELTGAIEILKTLFETDAEGKYDISKINYNKILDIYLDKTDIIGATVANIVRTKIKDPIKLPAAMKNSDLEVNYVSSGWKEEIKALIDGLKALKIIFDNDGNVSFEINDIVKSLKNVVEGSSKTNLERLYESDILKLTLYNAIASNTDAIKIPEDSVDLLYNVKDDKYIIKSEVETLISIIDDLNIEDIKNFDVKAIFADTEKLNKLDVSLSKSTILRYTITSYLLKSEDKVFVPDYAYDANTISKMISKEESSALIDIIKICGDLENFDYNKIFEKDIDEIKNMLRKSSIIRSTLTNNLKKNKNIGIPESAYDADMLPENENQASDRNEMLTIEEFGALLDMIKSLGSNSMENFNFDSLFTQNKELLISCLEKSTVLRYTIGAKLNETNEIVVPKAAYDLNVTADSRFLSGNSSDYLYTKVVSLSEIGILFDVIEQCGNTTKNFDFNNLFGNENIDFKKLVNESYILRKTVTDMMPSNILVPIKACEDILNDIFITKFEISTLFDLIKECGATATDFDFNNLLENTNLVNTINSSYILRATVTQTLDKTSAITVPVAAKDKDAMPIYRGIDDTEAKNNFKAITTDEMTNLFNCINNLKIKNTNEFDFNSFLATEDIANTINTSLILRCTVTKTICSTSKLVVTVDAMDSNYSELILSDTELTNLVNVINQLGANNLNDVNVSISKIKGSFLDSVFESIILTSTISDTMYKNNCYLDSKYNNTTKLCNADSISANDYYVMDALYMKEYINTIVSILGDGASYGSSITLSSYDEETLKKISKMADSRIILLTNSENIIQYVENINKYLSNIGYSTHRINVENYEQDVSDVRYYDQKSGFNTTTRTIVSDVGGLIEEIKNVIHYLQ